MIPVKIYKQLSKENKDSFSEFSCIWETLSNMQYFHDPQCYIQKYRILCYLYKNRNLKICLSKHDLTAGKFFQK